VGRRTRSRCDSSAKQSARHTAPWVPPAASRRRPCVRRGWKPRSSCSTHGPPTTRSSRPQQRRRRSPRNAPGRSKSDVTNSAANWTRCGRRSPRSNPNWTNDERRSGSPPVHQPRRSGNRPKSGSPERRCGWCAPVTANRAQTSSRLCPRRARSRMRLPNCGCCPPRSCAPANTTRRRRRRSRNRPTRTRWKRRRQPATQSLSPSNTPSPSDKLTRRPNRPRPNRNRPRWHRYRTRTRRTSHTHADRASTSWRTSSPACAIRLLMRPTKRRSHRPPRMSPLRRSPPAVRWQRWTPIRSRSGTNCCCRSRTARFATSSGSSPRSRTPRSRRSASTRRGGRRTSRRCRRVCERNWSSSRRRASPLGMPQPNGSSVAS
jgi:hypothetical protein